jgi:phosphoribosylformimino-5-aminoimidazole carboxamide ribotide isomerase
MAIQIVPSIDLRGGRVVRLKQGDYGRQVTYDVDPFATARSFADAGAVWMHVVDLDGAKEGRPVQTSLIADVIRSTGLRVEVGGGVRSTDDVHRLLEAGAARVVVGTRAMEDWPWFEALAHSAGMDDRIVLAIDAKDGRIATRAWTETTTELATDVARRVTGWPLAALLYTDVSKDGMLQGPNFEHTRALAESTDVSVIASGGVGSIEHVRQLAALPVWGAIVGRSLYEGTVNLREAIVVASRGTTNR